MTRDEVIRGLERCMGKVTCTGCPLECMEDDVCALTLLQEAVALLKDEQKRGRWVALDAHRGMEQFKCSACGMECYVPTCMGNAMYGFCPNCGAKMLMLGFAVLQRREE